MWQELGRLDPANRIGDQMAEFVALLVGDRGAEVLHLNQTLEDEEESYVEEWEERGP